MALTTNTIQHGGNIFAAARSLGCPWQEVLDFSASINPLGPSPYVPGAISQAMAKIVHYPEAEPRLLREALAQLWQLDPARLLVGNGATELLHGFAALRDWGNVSFAAPVFSEFHRAFPHAAIVPFATKHWPTEGLLVVSRPANPTGQMPNLHHYLEQTSNPVLVDESFLEFSGQPSLQQSCADRPNLFILRSLTKFYALPGLRIGAISGPADAIAAWRLSRPPWSVNCMAEAATLAAIADRDHAERTFQFVQGERSWLSDQLAALPKATVWPGQANYLLVELGTDVPALQASLLQHKILVRDCSQWAGVDCANAIRVAVRTRPENLRLLAALREFLCE